MEDTEEALLLLSPRRGVSRGLAAGGKEQEAGVEVEAVTGSCEGVLVEIGRVEIATGGAARRADMCAISVDTKIQFHFFASCSYKKLIQQS